MRRPSAILPVAALLLTSVARGDESGDVARWNEALDRGLTSRPHTIVEFELGAIVLPSAPIGAGQQGGSLPAGLTIGKGDATLQAGAHMLYRATPIWAVGALVLLAPFGTTNTGYGLGGSSGLARSHSRDYYLVGAEGRFVPIHYKVFEAWLGAQVGAIIVADRFTTTNAGAYMAPVGYPSVTERSEGLSGGVQIGASYSFSESFVVGFTLRASGWLLPSTPQCSAIGDCATLTNTAAVYEGGFLIGYRIPLF